MVFSQKAKLCPRKEDIAHATNPMDMESVFPERTGSIADDGIIVFCLRRIPPGHGDFLFFSKMEEMDSFQIASLGWRACDGF